MEGKRDLADLIYEHRKSIVIAVIALIASVAAFGLISHIKHKKREEAAYLFGKGLQYMSQGLASKDDQKLQEALKYFEKAEKVRAGRESIVAMAMRGRTLIALGKEKEGISLIKKALSNMEDSYLEPLFVATTGDENTIKGYLQKDNPFLEDYVRFQLAMVYLKKGEKEKAIGELKTIKGKFPDSPFARDAERIMEVIR